MPHKPKRKYGKYDFYIEKSQNYKGETRTRLIEFAGSDKRGFLFRDITKLLKSIKRVK